MSYFNTENFDSAATSAQPLPERDALEDFRDEVRRAHRYRWEANPATPFVELTPLELDQRVFRLISEIEQAMLDSWMEAMEAPGDEFSDEPPDDDAVQESPPPHR
jgi:hypothetical protein